MKSKNSDLRKDTSPSGKYTLFTYNVKRLGNFTTSGGLIYLSSVSPSLEQVQNHLIPTAFQKLKNLFLPLAPLPSPLLQLSRNYSPFIFTWAENHPNGEDYLIFGKDYQGYSVCNLNSHIVVNTLNPGARQGYGWCPAEFEVSEDLTRIRMRGCVWGGEFTVKTFDFTNPMKSPLPLLFEDEDE